MDLTEGAPGLVAFVMNKCTIIYLHVIFLPRHFQLRQQRLNLRWEIALTDNGIL